MILATNDKELEIAVKFSTAVKFQDKFCKEDETLLTFLPETMMKKNCYDVLIEILHFFQVNKNKMSKEQIIEFLDEYMVENKTDFYELYSGIINEFDVAGVLKRGMGFKMTKAILDRMSQMAEQFEQASEQTIE